MCQDVRPDAIWWSTMDSTTRMWSNRTGDRVDRVRPVWPECRVLPECLVNRVCRVFPVCRVYRVWPVCPDDDDDERAVHVDEDDVVYRVPWERLVCPDDGAGRMVLMTDLTTRTTLSMMDGRVSRVSVVYRVWPEWPAFRVSRGCRVFPGYRVCPELPGGLDDGGGERVDWDRLDNADGDGDGDADECQDRLAFPVCPDDVVGQTLDSMTLMWLSTMGSRVGRVLAECRVWPEWLACPVCQGCRVFPVYRVCPVLLVGPDDGGDAYGDGVGDVDDADDDDGQGRHQECRAECQEHVDGRQMDQTMDWTIRMSLSMMVYRVSRVSVGYRVWPELPVYLGCLVFRVFPVYLK